ncbi:MAG: hypothetical protein ACK4K0_06865 [Flavobacteriales bacterium]
MYYDSAPEDSAEASSESDFGFPPVKLQKSQRGINEPKKIKIQNAIPAKARKINKPIVNIA